MRCLEEKNAQHKTSIWNSIKKEIIFELDENNLIIEISHNVINILGFTYDEMIERSIFDFIGDDKYHYIFDLKFINDVDMLFTHKNGSLIHMELQMESIEDDNQNVIGKYGSMIDISRYKEIERSEEHFRIVLENAKDIIYRFEIIPEPKFVYMSSAAEEIFGYDVQTYYKNYIHVFNTAHPDDVSILYKKMNNELDYSKPIESRWIHKNGKCVWIEDYVTPVYDNHGTLIAFEGVCRDISERKALEEKLSYLTYNDSLTGLKNRTFYDKEINELNTKNNISVGVIVCDLDNLKVINDTIGHNKGDSIIKSASDLLLEVQSDYVSVARIGGDEFVILVKNTNEIKVKELCKKINLLIRNYNLINQEYPIQLSIGCAFNDHSIGQMGRIFEMADKNMYANKLSKRNIEEMI